MKNLATQKILQPQNMLWWQQVFPMLLELEN